MAAIPASQRVSLDGPAFAPTREMALLGVYALQEEKLLMGSRLVGKQCVHACLRWACVCV